MYERIGDSLIDCNGREVWQRNLLTTHQGHVGNLRINRCADAFEGVGQKLNQRLLQPAHRRFSTCGCAREKVEHILFGLAEEDLSGDQQSVVAVDEIQCTQEPTVIQVSELTTKIHTLPK